MNHEIWAHVGAYGELKALLPILDSLHQKYREMGVRLTVNSPDMLELDLASIRSYFTGPSRILKGIPIWKLYGLFLTFKPALWISHSFDMETNMLWMCSQFQIPVFYIFEGFCGFSQPETPPDFTTTVGAVTQEVKRLQFEQLGIEPARIVRIKNLKWIG